MELSLKYFQRALTYKKTEFNISDKIIINMN